MLVNAESCGIVYLANVSQPTGGLPNKFSFTLLVANTAACCLPKYVSKAEADMSCEDRACSPTFSNWPKVLQGSGSSSMQYLS